MRKVRCYCELIQAQSILDETESGHLCRVMRAKKETPVELIDGRGTLAVGRLVQADKKQAVIAVDHTEHMPPSDKRLILAVSFAKGQRFDSLVEKCTELGVDHIVAVQFERSVKQGSASGMKRYRKISIAAAKQSGRLFLPDISGPLPLAQALADLNNHYPQSATLFGDPSADSIIEISDLKTQHDIIVVIGPEGGMTETETKLLQSHGGRGVSVNKNVLRIETAATAFCAILNCFRC